MITSVILLVDKRLESIYLLDEIEVCMKRVSNMSNVTAVQKEKIVTDQILDHLRVPDTATLDTAGEMSCHFAWMLSKMF